MLGAKPGAVNSFLLDLAMRTVQIEVLCYQGKGVLADFIEET